jgi:type VI secretion system protein ImpK
MGLKAMGLDDKTQSEARYCLAAFIDEFVLQTPWGAHGPWAKNSLLETLHQESWGGERVFDWIEAWLEQPTIYGHQLEYSLLLLRMGFRGKYGVIHDGDAALEPLKKRIEHALELPPVDRLQGLSSGIVGHVMGSPKSRPTPFWVLFSWTGLALCLVMIVLMTRLGQRSETLMATVMSENPHPPAGSH